MTDTAFDRATEDYFTAITRCTQWAASAVGNYLNDSIRPITRDDSHYNFTLALLDTWGAAPPPERAVLAEAFPDIAAAFKLAPHPTELGTLQALTGDNAEAFRLSHIHSLLFVPCDTCGFEATAGEIVEHVDGGDNLNRSDGACLADEGYCSGVTFAQGLHWEQLAEVFAS